MKGHKGAESWKRERTNLAQGGMYQGHEKQKKDTEEEEAEGNNSLTGEKRKVGNFVDGRHVDAKELCWRGAD